MSALNSEEEYIVYAEFDDNINIETYRGVHVLGIDTRNPIIQMDDTFFTGKYEPALGTYLFFEDDPDAETSDSLFDKLPDKPLKYLHKTGKLVKLELTYVIPKEGTEQEIQNRSQEQEENMEVINFTSLQSAIDKFTKEWASKTELESITESTSGLLDNLESNK